MVNNTQFGLFQYLNKQNKNKENKEGKKKQQHKTYREKQTLYNSDKL